MVRPAEEQLKCEPNTATDKGIYASSLHIPRRNGTLCPRLNLPLNISESLMDEWRAIDEVADNLFPLNR